IKAKKDHVSSTNGEISALWDQVEKLGINKRGARIFLTLDGMEDYERKDVLRTIQKMAAEAGWDESGDMVDKAEGNNVVKMPAPADPKGKGKGKAKDEPAPPPADDSDLADLEIDPNEAV